MRPDDLKERYGPGWAIVTGGSDGIGREFAKDLAKKGFDVAISSRSQSKLDKVKEEIETLYPNRKVKTYSIDYSKAPDYS